MSGDPRPSGAILCVSRRLAFYLCAETHRDVNLLIPRIADSTTRKDLIHFANKVLEKWLRLPFSAQPRIVSCRILHITDHVGVTQRHGLINVTPDDAALKIIRKLNGQYLNGKRVGVKQYRSVPDDSPDGLE